jgi:hypothetical protein
MIKRKPNRLRDYDYSVEGYYFVTICTKNRVEWFGKIVNGEWQKSFYDHVIRNEKSLHNLRHYITFNSLKWEFDRENKKGLNTCCIQKSCKDYYNEIVGGL